MQTKSVWRLFGRNAVRKRWLRLPRVLGGSYGGTAMTKINTTQILPIAMILLDVGAAAVCLWHKDYRRAVYWIAAAVLNLTVTF